ncbi:MAG: metalloregulator ArsR/SmtB family transcription factor [Rhizomicrobium sp.]
MTALQASSSLTALADPTRQRIVEMLASGALSSGEIAGRFELSPPAISQHLKTLKQARLVSVRVDRQKRIYSLDPAGVEEVSEWVACIRAFWNPRLDALAAALKKDSK